MAIDAAAAASSGSATLAGRKSLASNFDTFLSLLTTQMKNQDPLSPMDSTEFTNQLVQFAQVEQQINSNESLTNLIGLSQQNIVTNSVNYIGKTVEANIASNFGMANPEGYRKAMRLMQLAERYGLPVVSIVDTPGAYPGLDAEARGQAEAIARNLTVMATLRTPFVVVVTGEQVAVRPLPRPQWQVRQRRPRALPRADATIPPHLSVG